MDKLNKRLEAVVDPTTIQKAWLCSNYSVGGIQGKSLTIDMDLVAGELLLSVNNEGWLCYSSRSHT